MGPLLHVVAYKYLNARPLSIGSLGKLVKLVASNHTADWAFETVAVQSARASVFAAEGPLTLELLRPRKDECKALCSL